VCKTWSFSLRKGQRLKLLIENKVLRRIHGPKAEEVKGGRRILHVEKLCSLYSL
jgi:hypothetical protein